MQLNPRAEITILDLGKRFGYGAGRILNLLRQIGSDVSNKQIEQLLLRDGLVEPNV